MGGIDLDRLKALSVQKNRNDRETIEMEELYQESRTFVSQISELVEREINVTAAEGQKLGDFFWREVEDARGTGKSDEQCRVGTRVTRRGNSLSFQWYKNSFFKTGPGETKMQIRSKYINQTVKGSYSMNSFKTEPKWAQEIIEMIEGRYNVLRRRNTALKELRQALNAYQKLVEESHGM